MMSLNHFLLDSEPNRTRWPIKCRTAEPAETDRNQNRELAKFETMDSSISSVSSFRSRSRSGSKTSLTKHSFFPNLHDDTLRHDLYKAYGYDYRTFLSGKKLTDTFLLAWHSVVLVTAIAVVILAVFIYFGFSTYIDLRLRELPSYDTYRKFIKEPKRSYNFHFYSQFDVLCSFIIVVNLLYIASASVFLNYSSHRNPWTFPISTLVSCLLLVLEAAFVNIIFNRDLLNDDETVRKLQARLDREYRVFGQDEFSIVQDHISIWLECCGIVDSFDFFNVTFQVKGKTPIQNPPSCCRRHVFEEGIEAVQSCIANGDGTSIYQGGCVDSYMNWLQDVCHAYVIYMWIHVLDCLLHAALYRRKINFVNAMLSSTYGNNA
ncbi:hypothetical protein EGW08_021368 [Elysia chlorotica]|uniref:Tetraspanin n=1 Tax=Elysia chlorotica TaxID=188477 RepID=A0A3S1AXI1_ELYCH|nr:hypothetical protein EGW08_021368 [Elysia chlorotica]